MTERDAAFLAFFQAEEKNLQSFATFVSCEPDEAYDLVQEALVRTYRAWKRIDEPGVYARRIVVNLTRDRARRRRVRLLRPLSGERTERPQPHDVIERLMVIQGLKLLTPIRRAVVVLRFYEDMSERQIAEALERPLGTVKSDLHRALATLRPVFERERSQT